MFKYIILSMNLAAYFTFWRKWIHVRETDTVQRLNTSVFLLTSLGAALAQLVCQAPVKKGNEQLVYLNASERAIFVNFKIKLS